MSSLFTSSSVSIRVDQDHGPKEDVDEEGSRNGDDPTQSIKQSHNTWDSATSKLVIIWKRLGLDVPTLLTMMKGGLPPTIAIAMYQDDGVAQTYSTLGYLVAIVSIFGFCIMPRAKFIQTMVFNIVATCISGGVCMLMVWSGVQARINTSSGNPAAQRYNSSQSAVCAIWLFFQIWLINTLKSKFPQLTFPSIICSIFVVIAAGYGPQFTSSAQAQTFMRRLLETFLTGLGLATAVSLFVFPLTMRKVVRRQMENYLVTLRKTFQAHLDYLHSLENTNVFSSYRTMTLRSGDNAPKRGIKKEIEALKDLDATLDQIHGKLHGDIAFSKREIAYGKLTADDLAALYKHLRDILVPLKGLSSVADLFERTAEKMKVDVESGLGLDEEEEEALREDDLEDWQDVMGLLHDPVSDIIHAMDGGLAHVMMRLQLNSSDKRDKKKVKSDAEAKGDLLAPGDERFGDFLEAQSEKFNGAKEAILRQWVKSKGIKADDGFTRTMTAETMPGLKALQKEPTVIQQRNQRQLYLLLYMLFLLHSISHAVLRLVRFADERNHMNRKSKLIYPGRKRFKKWIHGVLKAQDTNAEDEATLGGLDTRNTVVYLGEAYKKRKDPEHLPPENAWEELGDRIRAIARFFRSPDASFGFRVACATMTIAVVGFLKDTQQFFINQRFVWALIMVSISMTPTAGQSVWAFFLRALGTLFAMIMSWLIWYIPGQKTAGILVFLWFFLSLAFYIPLKRPDFIVIGLIFIITTTLIVGYEHQVRVIGIEQSQSNGQPVYPIYLFGPYRLATVLGGLAVAFIWTFFPFPVSEHSAVRRKLGASLYLAANYYSVTHETVMGRIRGDEGDPTDKASPGYQLAKARHRVFAKQQLLLQGLRTHNSFVKWEFPIGGKFPKKHYDSIIQLVANIMNYSALIAYSSAAFSHPAFSHPKYIHGADDPSQVEWFQAFRRVVGEARLTSHEITSTLALLSSSITNGQPLPPYLVAPQAYRLSKRMEAIDQDILSLKHIAEPGYAAFAVLQISTSCITMDLEKLLKAVKKLVGELDFSFHVVSTQSKSISDGSATPRSASAFYASAT